MEIETQTKKGKEEQVDEIILEERPKPSEVYRKENTEEEPDLITKKVQNASEISDKIEKEIKKIHTYQFWVTSISSLFCLLSFFALIFSPLLFKNGILDFSSGKTVSIPRACDFSNCTVFLERDLCIVNLINTTIECSVSHMYCEGDQNILPCNFDIEKNCPVLNCDEEKFEKNPIRGISILYIPMSFFFMMTSIIFGALVLTAFEHWKHDKYMKYEYLVDHYDSDSD